MRQSLAVDNSLPKSLITKSGDKLVFLNARHSQHADEEVYESDRVLLASFEKALQRGEIAKHLQNATYHTIIWDFFPFRTPLPYELTHLQREGSTSVRDRKFITALTGVPKGGLVVFVLAGHDGCSGNKEGWQVFLDKWPHLKFAMIIGQEPKMWHHRQDLWSYHDWTPKILDRYWATIDLRRFVQDPGCCRLYKQLAAQWEAGNDRRDAVAAAYNLEGGPTIGRNFNPAKKPRNQRR